MENDLKNRATPHAAPDIQGDGAAEDTGWAETATSLQSFPPHDAVLFTSSLVLIYHEPSWNSNFPVIISQIHRG